MTDDNDVLEFNQKTCARLLNISLQAFQRWELKPVRREGREAYYLWSEVEVAATNKRRRSTRNALPRTFESAEAENLPEAMELAGGNLLRLIFWQQCGALCGSVSQSIAIDAREDDWERLFGITAEQKAAIILRLGFTIPRIFDVFVSYHHEKWFEEFFGIGIDQLASELLRRDVKGGARPHGEFTEEFGSEDDLPPLVRALIPQAKALYAERPAEKSARKRTSG